MPFFKSSKTSLVSLAFAYLLLANDAHSQSYRDQTTKSAAKAVTTLLSYYRDAIHVEALRQATDPQRTNDYVHIPEIGFLESTHELDLNSKTKQWKPAPVEKFLGEKAQQLYSKWLDIVAAKETFFFDEAIEQIRVNLVSLEKDNGSDFSTWDMYSRRKLLDVFERTMLLWWHSRAANLASYRRTSKVIYRVAFTLGGVAGLSFFEPSLGSVELVSATAIFGIAAPLLSSFFHNFKAEYRTAIFNSKLAYHSPSYEKEEKTKAVEHRKPISELIAEEVLNPRGSYLNKNDCKHSFDFRKILKQ